MEPFRNFFTLFVMCVANATAGAHVQVMIPATDMGGGEDSAAVEIDVRFVEHAADNGPILDMKPPAQVGVLVNGERTEFHERIQQAGEEGARRYRATHTMRKPGAHIYYLEPQPYFDDAEEVAIVHYTKAIVDSTSAKLPTESSLGWENWEGWEQLVGFPVEIEPYVQPTSLWTNSLFRGRVFYNGRPAPYTRIEVEYLDTADDVNLPSNAFKTQILGTNQDGEFAFTPVKADWWALTALPDIGARTLSTPAGRDYSAELGGVLWIRVHDIE